MLTSDKWRGRLCHGKNKGRLRSLELALRAETHPQGERAAAIFQSVRPGNKRENWACCPLGLPHLVQ